MRDNERGMLLASKKEQLCVGWGVWFVSALSILLALCCHVEV